MRKKRNITKRVLASILSASMIVTSVYVPSFAEEAVIDEAYEEAVVSDDSFDAAEVSVESPQIPVAEVAAEPVAIAAEEADLTSDEDTSEADSIEELEMEDVSISELEDDDVYEGDLTDYALDSEEVEIMLDEVIEEAGIEAMAAEGDPDDGDPDEGDPEDTVEIQENEYFVEFDTINGYRVYLPGQKDTLVAKAMVTEYSEDGSCVTKEIPGTEYSIKLYRTLSDNNEFQDEIKLDDDDKSPIRITQRDSEPGVFDLQVFSTDSFDGFIKVTATLPDEIQTDKDTPANLYNSIDFHIAENCYRIETSSDSATDRYVPGERSRLHARLVNESNSYGSQNIDNVSFKWDSNTDDVSIDGDGHDPEIRISEFCSVNSAIITVRAFTDGYPDNPVVVKYISINIDDYKTGIDLWMESGNNTFIAGTSKTMKARAWERGRDQNGCYDRDLEDGDNAIHYDWWISEDNTHFDLTPDPNDSSRCNITVLDGCIPGEYTICAKVNGEGDNTYCCENGSQTIWVNDDGYYEILIDNEMIDQISKSQIGFDQSYNIVLNYYDSESPRGIKATGNITWEIQCDDTVFDTSAEKSKLSFHRKTNYSTDITLIAKMNGEEVDRYDFWVDHYDLIHGFDNLRFPWENSTSFFPKEENYSISLDCEKDLPEGARVQISVEGDDEVSVEDMYSIDNYTITFKSGVIWAEMDANHRPVNFYINAEIIKENDVDETTEPEVFDRIDAHATAFFTEYNFDPLNNRILVGDEQYVDRHVDVWIMNPLYPEGEWVSAELTDVKIESQEEDQSNPSIICEQDGEYGYNFRAVDCGSVCITYEVLASDKKNYTFTQELYVSDYASGIDLETSTGDFIIVPGGSLHIVADGWYREKNKYNEEQSGPLEHVRYDWGICDDDVQYPLQYSMEENEFDISWKDDVEVESDNYRFYVRAIQLNEYDEEVYEDGELCIAAYEEFDIHICEDRFRINIEGPGSLIYGQGEHYKAELIRDSVNDDDRLPENYYIRWEFDNDLVNGNVYGENSEFCYIYPEEPDDFRDYYDRFQIRAIAYECDEDGNEHEIVRRDWQIYINNSRTYIDISSMSDTNQVVPGQSITLSAQAYEEGYDEYNSRYQNELTNVLYKWEIVTDTDDLKIDDAESGVFTAAENAKDQTVTVVVKAYKEVEAATGENQDNEETDTSDNGVDGQELGDENEGSVNTEKIYSDQEFACAYYDIEIKNGYYQLKQVQDNYVKYGETITIAPELLYFTKGNPEGEKVNYKISYEENDDPEYADVISISKKENAEALEVTLNEIKDTYFWIEVVLDTDDDEAPHYSESMLINILPYSYFKDFENLRDDGNTNLFMDCANIEKDYYVSAVYEQLQENEELRIYAYKWDDDDNRVEVEGYINVEPATGKDSDGYCRDKIYFNLDKIEEYDSFGVAACVIINDNEKETVVDERCFDVYTEKCDVRFYNSPIPDTMCLYDEFEVKQNQEVRGFIKDPCYPNGFDFEGKVTSIEVATGKALNVKPVENVYKIEAVNPGEAELAVYFDCEDWGSNVISYTYVSEDQYYINIWNHENSNVLFPGETHTYEARLMHRGINDNGDYFEDEVPNAVFEWYCSESDKDLFSSISYGEGETSRICNITASEEISWDDYLSDGVFVNAYRFDENTKEMLWCGNESVDLYIGMERTGIDIWTDECNDSFIPGNDFWVHASAWYQRAGYDYDYDYNLSYVWGCKDDNLLNLIDLDQRGNDLNIRIHENADYYDDAVIWVRAYDDERNEFAYNEYYFWIGNYREGVNITSKNKSNRMRPCDYDVLSAEAFCEGVNREGQRYGNALEDVTYAWSKSNNDDPFTLEIDENDSSKVTVTIGENAEDGRYDLCVSAYRTDEAEPFVEKWYSIEVNSDYYEIALPDSDILLPGMSMSYTPEIWHYSNTPDVNIEEILDISDLESFKCDISDYNDKILTINQEVTKEILEYPTYTIQKAENSYESFKVHCSWQDAEDNKYEVERWIDLPDYQLLNGFEGVIIQEDNCSVLFPVDESSTEDDKSFTLSPIIEKTVKESIGDLGVDVDIQIAVETCEDEPRDPNKIYGVNAIYEIKNGNVTFDMNALKAYLEYGNPMGLRVYATAKINDVLADETATINDVLADETETFIDLRYSDKYIRKFEEEDLLVGEEYRVGKKDVPFYIIDIDYPYGDELTAEVTGVTVSGKAYDEYGDDDNVLVCTEEDDCWTFIAGEDGEASITYTVKVGEDEYVISSTKYIHNEMDIINVWRDGETAFFPGDSVSLYAEGVHRASDKEDQALKNVHYVWSLDGENFDEKALSNDAITLEPYKDDPLKCKLTANNTFEGRWSGDVYIAAKNDANVVVASNCIWIDVTDERTGIDHWSESQLNNYIPGNEDTIYANAWYQRIDNGREYFDDIWYDFSTENPDLTLMQHQDDSSICDIKINDDAKDAFAQIRIQAWRSEDDEEPYVFAEAFHNVFINRDRLVLDLMPQDESITNPHLFPTKYMVLKTNPWVEGYDETGEYYTDAYKADSESEVRFEWGIAYAPEGVKANAEAAPNTDTLGMVNVNSIKPSENTNPYDRWINVYCRMYINDEEVAYREFSIDTSDYYSFEPQDINTVPGQSMYLRNEDFFNFNDCIKLHKANGTDEVIESIVPSSINFDTEKNDALSDIDGSLGRTDRDILGNEASKEITVYLNATFRSDRRLRYIDGSCKMTVTPCEHQFSDYYYDENATCTTDGTETRWCQICDLEETRTSADHPKLGHEKPESVTTTASTCVKQGTVVYTCERCGQKVTEYLPLAAHKPNASKTVDKAPTCTADGSKSTHCSVCNAVISGTTETIKANGHTVVTDSAVSPTCTTEGKTAGSHCKVCGAVIVKQNPVSKLAHKYGDWTVVKNPTVFAEGLQQRTCSVCGGKDSAAIKKLTPTISLNATKLPLKVGQTTKVVKVTMAEGDSIASWKSSNTKIAKVDKKGAIKGLKVGKAVITVTLKSGISAKINITVQKKAVTTSKVVVTDKKNLIKKNKLTLKKKEKDTLIVALNPLTSTDKITFSTNNKKVATVDKKGNIVAKGKGTAKITVKAGKKKAVITVSVK